MKASEVLRESLAKLDGGKKWSKGCPEYPNSYCASTVISWSCRSVNSIEPARDVLSGAIGLAFGMERIWAWNDAPERTFADVEAAFQKAIALAEAEGN